VISLYILVLFRILAAAFCKRASEESITIIHPAGDESMHNGICVLKNIGVCEIKKKKPLCLDTSV